MMYCTFVVKEPSEVRVERSVHSGNLLVTVRAQGEGLWFVLPEKMALELAQEIQALKPVEDSDVRAA